MKTYLIRDLNTAVQLITKHSDGMCTVRTTETGDIVQVHKSTLMSTSPKPNPPRVKYVDPAEQMKAVSGNYKL